MSVVDIRPPLLDDLQIEQLRKLIQEETGILISVRKKRDVIARLTDYILEFKTVQDFFNQIQINADFKQQIINKLTIGESYFFRNHPHFEALKSEILPEIIKRNHSEKRLKIWSAGSSSGEEPFSIAIMLQRNFPLLHNWDVEILATDINTEYIEKAQKGIYNNWSFRGVDQVTISSFFKKQKDDTYLLDDSIRKKVKFSPINLALIPDKLDARLKNCDLIVCRNVLIYFSHQLATDICETFADSLVNKGYLLLGHSESFPTLTNMKTIYSHATYYYHKDIMAYQHESEDPKHHMSLVPGLGPYDPQKLIAPTITQPPTMFTTQNVQSEKYQKQPFARLNSELTSAIEEDLKHVRDYSMEGELGKAEQLLNKLEEADGKLDYRVHFLKALVADQKNEIEDSLQHLKQAIFLNKKFVIGHYYQGIIAERTGDLILALRSYRNTCRLAEELRPDSEVKEGGGITAGRLLEISNERQKELNRQND